MSFQSIDLMFQIFPTKKLTFFILILALGFAAVFGLHMHSVQAQQPPAGQPPPPVAQPVPTTGGTPATPNSGPGGAPQTTAQSFQPPQEGGALYKAIVGGVNWILAAIVAVLQYILAIFTDFLKIMFDLNLRTENLTSPTVLMGWQ